MSFEGYTDAEIAVSAAIMELEDPWVSQVTATFAVEEQPIFLIAYQCFILWAVSANFRQRLLPPELEELTKSVRDAFESCSYHAPPIFTKILPYMQQFMPMAQEGGRDTKAVYPMPIIIQAATSAGFPLPQNILDYRLGVHALAVLKRLAVAFSPATNSNQQSDFNEFYRGLMATINAETFYTKVLGGLPVDPLKFGAAISEDQLRGLEDQLRALADQLLS